MNKILITMSDFLRKQNQPRFPTWCSFTLLLSLPSRHVIERKNQKLDIFEKICLGDFGLSIYNPLHDVCYQWSNARPGRPLHFYRIPGLVAVGAMLVMSDFEINATVTHVLLDLEGNRRFPLTVLQ